MSGSSFASISQSSGCPGDRIPFDQHHFVRDATLGQLLVVEPERDGDPLAEVAAVVVVAGGDDDAEER